VYQIEKWKKWHSAATGQNKTKNKETYKGTTDSHFDDQNTEIRKLDMRPTRFDMGEKANVQQGDQQNLIKKSKHATSRCTVNGGFMYKRRETAWGGACGG